MAPLNVFNTVHNNPRTQLDHFESPKKFPITQEKSLTAWLRELIQKTPHVIDRILSHLHTADLVSLHLACPTLLEGFPIALDLCEINTGPLHTDSYLEALGELFGRARSIRKLVLGFNITHYSSAEISRIGKLLSHLKSNQNLQFINEFEICHVTYGSRRRTFDWSILGRALSENFPTMDSHVRTLTISRVGHLVPPIEIVTQEISFFPGADQVFNKVLLP